MTYCSIALTKDLSNTLSILFIFNNYIAMVDPKTLSTSFCFLSDFLKFRYRTIILKPESTPYELRLTVLNCSLQPDINFLLFKNNLMIDPNWNSEKDYVL